MTDNDKKYKIWWDEKNSVGQCWSKDLDEKSAKEVKESFVSVMEKRKGRVNWIVDLSGAKKTPNAKARKHLVELIKHPQMGTVAFVSPNLANRVAVKFIYGAASKGEVNSFGNIDEALNWLNNT